jgi:hypothetical protein
MRQEFQIHMLNEHGIAKATKLYEIFSTTLIAIEEIVPAGRERALVATKLQEACFYAQRGIAVDVANQLTRAIDVGGRVWQACPACCISPDPRGPSACADCRELTT